jgi:signal peptidase
MSALATRVPRGRVHQPRLSGALRLVDRGSTMVCGLALMLLAVLLLALATGYRPLIDHSDSMRPALRAGDLLIIHAEPATGVRRGDIVSFRDPGLGGKLVTHRVVLTHSSGRRIDFLTRGDANPTPERWSVARKGSIGKLAIRVPDVGRGMAWMAEPWTRTILLTLTALLLSTALLRRIWRA